MEFKTVLKFLNLETIHYTRGKFEKFLARMETRVSPPDPCINDQVKTAHEIVSIIDQHISKNYQSTDRT